MRKVNIIIAAFFLLNSAPVFAQADSTRYINGLPVSEDDTATHIQQTDVDPDNRQIAISANDLPPRLREVLDSQDTYKGWQDTTVYYQKNTGLYILPLKDGESVRIFGLTENGDPVSFSEVSRRKER